MALYTVYKVGSDGIPGEVTLQLECPNDAAAIIHAVKIANTAQSNLEVMEGMRLIIRMKLSATRMNPHKNSARGKLHIQESTFCWATTD